MLKLLLWGWRGRSRARGGTEVARRSYGRRYGRRLSLLCLARAHLPRARARGDLRRPARAPRGRSGARWAGDRAAESGIEVGIALRSRSAIRRRERRGPRSPIGAGDRRGDSAPSLARECCRCLVGIDLKYPTAASRPSIGPTSRLSWRRSRRRSARASTPAGPGRVRRGRPRALPPVECRARRQGGSVAGYERRLMIGGFSRRSWTRSNAPPASSQALGAAADDDRRHPDQLR